MWLNAGKRMKNVRVRLWRLFGVFEVTRGKPSLPWNICIVTDDSRVFVINLRSVELRKGRERFLAIFDRINYLSAPERTLRESLHVKSGDNPKVIGAAFERFEQVRI